MKPTSLPFYLLLFVFALACGEGTVAPGDPRDFLGQSNPNQPILKVIGDSEIVLERHFEPYVELGAQASSLSQGDISDQILISGSVNHFVVGDYQITYRLPQQQGQTFLTTTRLVRVRDRLPPNGEIQFVPQFDYSSELSTEGWLTGSEGPRQFSLMGQDPIDPITQYRARSFHRSDEEGPFPETFCQNQNLSSAPERPIGEAFSLQAQDGYQVVCAVAGDEHGNFQSGQAVSQSAPLRVVSGQAFPLSVANFDESLTNDSNFQFSVPIMATGSDFERAVEYQAKLVNVSSGEICQSDQFSDTDSWRDISQPFSGSIVVGDFQTEDWKLCARGRNALGNLTQQSYSNEAIRIDRTPPSLEFQEGREVIVWELCQDFVYDEALYAPQVWDDTGISSFGLRAFLKSGEEIPISNEGEVDFAALAVLGFFGGSIQYLATDLAGNQASLSQTVQSIKVIEELGGLVLDQGLRKPADFLSLGTNARALLCQDIDFGGEGISGLGSLQEPFQGAIVGRESASRIENFRIEASAEDAQGFVRVLGAEGRLDFLEFDGAEVLAANSSAAVVGVNYGSLSRIRLSNSVVRAQNQSGGLVGENFGVIEDARVLASSVRVANEGGGLVGRQHPNARIDRALVDFLSSVISLDAVQSVGGLVGRNSGEISRSASLEMQVGDFDSLEPQLTQVGGLVGVNDLSGTILNSYSRAEVRGQSRLGGLVGRNMGSASVGYSYALGGFGLSIELDGEDYASDFQIGGLVGFNSSLNSVLSSYWNIDLYGFFAEGIDPNRYGIGITDDQMRGWPADEESSEEGGEQSDSSAVQTFDDWDSELWSFELGSYPELKWILDEDAFF
ncbi:MAG: DUF5011 domain-containing protein [Bradymonadales bacterium]|nr:MAG: DUF5011 domain-containing protein [Bradymonadales bacterium]